MRTLKRIWQTKGLARYMLVIGLILTLMFVIFAIFAPWIAPYDFAQTRVDGVKFAKSSPSSSDHWLGTNDQFYDIFSRVIWGSRTALKVVLLSVVFSAAIGVPLGLASGFVGGWIDRVLVFLMDAIYSFPSLLLAIVFAFWLQNSLDAEGAPPPLSWILSAFGSGEMAAALSLTAIYVPQYFRVVRNTTVAAREATYVEAARALGAGPFTIMRKYLFGNVVQSVPVIGTLNAADALSTLAALGFLGLGIQPTDAAEWGYDLSRALDNVSAGDLAPALWPGLAIILLITGLTLVGEGLNETLNPTLRRRRLQKVRFDAREVEA